MTEELNKLIGFENDISTYTWPEFDEDKTIDDEIEIPVQVNGKLKATIKIVLDEEESSVKEKALDAISNVVEGKTVLKEIYVKNKIYNVVVK